MSVSIEQVKLQIDSIANEAYDNGWLDCKYYYSKQDFSAARTEALSITVQGLQKENKQMKSKLAHATRLLRFAQTTPCGANGQFDSFFDDPYPELVVKSLVAND